MYVCMCVNTYVWMYVCMYVFMYVYVYMTPAMSSPQQKAQTMKKSVYPTRSQLVSAAMSP